MTEHLLDCPSFQVVTVFCHVDVLRKLKKVALTAFRDFTPLAVAHLQVGPAPETGAKLQVLGPCLNAASPWFGVLQGGTHLVSKIVGLMILSFGYSRPAICRLCSVCCVKTRLRFSAYCSAKIDLRGLVGLCPWPKVGASHWTLTLADP